MWVLSLFSSAVNFFCSFYWPWACMQTNFSISLLELLLFCLFSGCNLSFCHFVFFSCQLFCLSWMWPCIHPYFFILLPKSLVFSPLYVYFLGGTTCFSSFFCKFESLFTQLSTISASHLAVTSNTPLFLYPLAGMAFYLVLFKFVSLFPQCQLFPPLNCNDLVSRLTPTSRWSPRMAGRSRCSHAHWLLIFPLIANGKFFAASNAGKKSINVKLQREV